jgi:UDP-N-acetylglucosamine 2-epimerase
MKILTVVGARPQFIKAAPVSRALRAAGHTEFLVHTGQHYDYGMSQVFFDEMDLPAPDVNLGIGSGLHGRQTGQMLMALEEIMQVQQPDRVLVYGDTNSTLAGALAAVKLHLPVAHVEAGLRSFNRLMPEEINRVLTDHVSDLLLCPSQTAVDNLAREGITEGVHLVGDVMFDALLYTVERGQTRSIILSNLGLSPKGYLLATIHRAENTDNEACLRGIFEAFESIKETIILPLHPRTAKMLDKFNLKSEIRNLKLINPVGYLDMVMLAQNARLILTDSGGLQKEAYWLGVPCLTLRDETEWVETVEAGWNVLTGADREKIATAVQNFNPSSTQPNIYGNGQAVRQIISLIDHSNP